MPAVPFGKFVQAVVLEGTQQKLPLNGFYQPEQVVEILL
jgi:hypothetical protein